MKTPLLALICASVFLSACATQPPARPTPPNHDADAFLQPTKIVVQKSQDCPVGPYDTLTQYLLDPLSTTRCLIDFGGAAEDANTRGNADKQSAQRILHHEKTP